MTTRYLVLLWSDKAHRPDRAVEVAADNPKAALESAFAPNWSDAVSEYDRADVYEVKTPARRYQLQTMWADLGHPQ